jgi:hypothetical protein
VRLFSKAPAGTLINYEASRENFYRDIAVEVLVVGAINHPHPTRTDFLDNTAVAQSLAD